VWYKNVSKCFFRFVTDHAFNGQTDRRTDIILMAPCVTLHAVALARKKNLKIKGNVFLNSV